MRYRTRPVAPDERERLTAAAGSCVARGYGYDLADGAWTNLGTIPAERACPPTPCEGPWACPRAELAALEAP